MSKRPAWLPTLSLGFAAFIFVTSEFTPVGLLSEIAAAFGRNESETGLLMTVYAWVVALLSLPLTASVARWNRRPLTLTLLAVFVAAHVLCVVAPSFYWLILARLLVASAHAIFWAVVTPLGIRLAPEGQRERALSILATGATLGGVLGIPVATAIGQAFGWRSAFAAIGLSAAVIGLVLARTLPSTPSVGGGGLRSVGSLLRRPKLRLCYLLTVLFMTGHYTVYTYISPLVQDVGGMRKELVASVLLAFGLSGFAGSLVAPPFLKRHLKSSGLLSILVIGLCLLSVSLALGALPSTLLLCVCWGAMFLLFNLVLQSLVLGLAPDAEDVAMAGFSAIYNVGIGGGALIGSVVSVHHLPRLGLVGAAFVGAAGLVCSLLLRGPVRIELVGMGEGH